jgi:gliding motility-associated protein GldL
MTFAELTQTKGWKQFMAKLYGIGAAVVIVGALFKIMHWPGAGLMLIIGLTTEALIFTFSAFEPLHEEDDWSLVFPQLAGLSEDDEISTPQLGSSSEDPKLKQEQLELNKQMLEQIKALRPHGSASAIEKFDKLVESNLGPDVFNKLSKGLNNLSDTTKNLSDLSSATVATNEYASNVKKASNSMAEMANSNQKITDKIKQSGKDLANSYQMLIDSMSLDFGEVAKSNTNYSEQLEVLNKNLSALNTVYEMQLQSTNESLQKSTEFYGKLDTMMGGMKDASKSADSYRNGVEALSKKLVALNTVYGNMLTAMNVKMD